MSGAWTGVSRGAKGNVRNKAGLCGNCRGRFEGIHRQHLDHLRARGARAACRDVGRAAERAHPTSANARQSFGTDSVTQQIDMGFSRDVDIAPTTGHFVPLEGEIITVPACIRG